MRKTSLFFVFIVLVTEVISQSIRHPVSGSYIGLGAYSKNHVDIFSFTQNQAALAQMNMNGVGVYAEKRFLLAATNFFSAVAVLPTTQGNFGVQADYFGFKNYNESQIGLAYAKSLGNNLDVAIKFNYYSFRIPSYGSSSAVNFEIGAIAHLTEKLNIGLHIYNPVGGKLSKTDNEKLSSIYKFGIGYEASEKFFISSEIIKEEDQPINVDAGIQYNFDKQFFVRAGTSTGSTNSYVGAGISWSNFRLDVTGSYHPQIGFTPGLMLILQFNN